MLYQIKNIYNTVELIRYPHEFREGGGINSYVIQKKLNYYIASKCSMAVSV